MSCNMLKLSFSLFITVHTIYVWPVTCIIIWKKFDTYLNKWLDNFWSVSINEYLVGMASVKWSTPAINHTFSTKKLTPSSNMNIHMNDHSVNRKFRITLNLQRFSWMNFKTLFCHITNLLPSSKLSSSQQLVTDAGYFTDAISKYLLM